MEKDKSTNHVGGSLPPSGRHSGFPPTGNNFSGKSEILSSSSTPPLNSSSQFSHDISQMPEKPQRNMGHRRAQSEHFSLPDDISFDSELGVVDGLNGPTYSDDTEDDLLSMYIELDKFKQPSPTSAFQLDDDVASASNERPRIRHQHSQSMDGSTTINPEMLVSGVEETSETDSRKAISAANLAELALIDPKRAKRIWANRQSAARSKERKMRYISELERKVRTLQTESTSLSGQLMLLQRDTGGLTAENSELKVRLQSIEQQVHLQDALNEALKEEIQHLKVMTGQANVPNMGPMMNFPVKSFVSNQQQPFYPNNNNNNNNNNHAMNTLLTAQQFQQLKIQSQTQQQRQLQQVGEFDRRGSSSFQSHRDNFSHPNP